MAYMDSLRNELKEGKELARELMILLNSAKNLPEEAEEMQLAYTRTKERQDNCMDTKDFLQKTLSSFSKSLLLLRFASSISGCEKGPCYAAKLMRNNSRFGVIKQIADPGIVRGVGRKQEVPMPERRTNTALEESGHFGWEGDDEAVIKLISVWGFGGVGKTTLCQFVHRDDKMHKGFDQKARDGVRGSEVLVKGRRPRLHGCVFRKNLLTLERRTSTELSGFANAEARLLEFHTTKQIRFLHGGSGNQTPMSSSTAAGGGHFPSTRTGGSINPMLVLTVSVAVGLYVQLFGYEYMQGNPVSTAAIFKGSPPSMFYAFVACIVFAFAGSFNALMLQNIPKLDKLRRLYSLFSVLFLASAFLILVSGRVLLMANYKLDLASLSSIWKMGGRNALFQLRP